MNSSEFRKATPRIALVAVLLLTLIPYCRLLGAYFVGYDDFIEIHRAAFEDSRQPARIFTTGHFHAAKYRPLNRAITLISYRLGGGRPSIFRVRNVFFHLLNTAIVFYLGTLLFDSVFTGALGAVLFGWNPLAHQAVAAAIWTNDAAATLALLAVTLGLWSYYAKRHSLRLLALAIAIAWVGTLVYEADIVAPAILILYLVLDSLCLRRLRVSRSWVWTLLLMTGAAVGCTMILRSLVLRGTGVSVVSLSSIARNGATYVAAVLLPVDPLLANRWFGTPLVPAALSSIRPWVFMLIEACGACVAAAVILALWKSARRKDPPASSVHCVFLLGAACLSILPLLVYNSHPSETYLYMPLSFLMLLLSRLLFLLRRRTPITFFMLTTLLLVSFVSACWERSRRVATSAAIAQRILTELPTANWLQGAWQICIANAPGYKLPQRYGLYTYEGLDTIGTGDGIRAVQDALQLRTGNEGISVDVLTAEEMVRACTPGTASQEPCYLVYPDGRVQQCTLGNGGNSVPDSLDH